MDSVKKFTPLSQEQISNIIYLLQQKESDIGDISPYLLQATQDNQKLIADYKDALDKKDFLENNIVEIAKFLNKCRLIGYYNESEEHIIEANEEIAKDEAAQKIAFTSESERQAELNKRLKQKVLLNMLLGAEAIEIICAYLMAKEKNSGQPTHGIQVVKNTTFVSPSGSKKHSDIFLENECIHQNFYKILSHDLQKNQGDFHQTYLIELFGVTGGNHVTTVTVHKKAGDPAPVFDLFDSSPAITRNGLIPAQNSIANGWSSVAINATIKKACEDSGLEFKDEQGFNQVAENGDRQLKISPIFTQFSHFVDSAIDPIATDFSQYTHRKKSGELESLLERYSEYKSDEALANTIIWQKTIRQKLGHLFEIVTDGKFVEMAFTAAQKEVTREYNYRNRLEFEGDPHFPAIEIDPALKPFEKKFNQLLPRTNKINCGSINSEGNYEFAIYIGNNTAKKLSRYLSDNFSLREYSTQNTENAFRFESINLSDKAIGLAPELQSITKISLTLTPNKAEEITKIISEQKLTFSQIFSPQPHQFSIPPKKIENAEGKRILEGQQQIFSS